MRRALPFVTMAVLVGAVFAIAAWAGLTPREFGFAGTKVVEVSPSSSPQNYGSGVAAAVSPSPSPAASLSPRPAVPSPGPSHATASPKPHSLGPASAQLTLVNQARAHRGLPAFAWNDCLYRIAGQASLAAADAGSWSGISYRDKQGLCNLNGPAEIEVQVGWSGGADDGAANHVMTTDSNDQPLIYDQYAAFMGAAWAVGADGTGYLDLEIE